MRWRVGFLSSVTGTGPGVRAWYHLVLRRYVHVWCARPVQRGIWLWLEWSHGDFTCGLVQAVFVRRASRSSALTIAWRSPSEPLTRPHLPQWGTHCACITAQAVRVAVPFATPWRLACALLREGGTAIRRTTP
jgi:hypothetical protein